MADVEILAVGLTFVSITLYVLYRFLFRKDTNELFGVDIVELFLLAFVFATVSYDIALLYHLEKTIYTTEMAKVFIYLLAVGVGLWIFIVFLKVIYKTIFEPWLGNIFK